MRIPTYPLRVQGAAGNPPWVWAGTVAPDGDADPWNIAPLGSQYTRVDAGNVRSFLKKIDAKADTDWKPVTPWTGATWSLDGNGRLINTPTVGADLVSNGGFDTDTVWTKGTGWTIAAGVADHAAGAVANLTQNVLTAESWYRIIWSITTQTASTHAAYFGSGTSTLRGIDRSAVGTYTDTMRASSTGGGVRALTASSAAQIDNVSIRLLTLSTLFRSLVSAAADTRIGVAVNAWLTSTQVGVVANLDSATAPANYIVAYLTGTGTANLDKVVAGTATNVIQGSVTFVADARLEVRRPSGNTYQLWYNNAQVGTDQTIADAGIISNSRYGVFSTNPNNTITAVYVNNGAVALL